MADAHPINLAASSLVAEACRQTTWHRALRLFALAPTEENVGVLRARAQALGLQTSHLRWRIRWEDISSEELRQAVQDANNYAAVHERLGISCGGTTYARLEELAAEHRVTLPPRGRQRRSDSTLRYACSDEVVRAAFLEARSIADLLRRVGLVPKGDNYRVMNRRLEALGLDARQLDGKRWAAGQALGRRPLEEVLQRGRRHDGPALVRRLLEAGMFERECALCGRNSWNAQPIPLELDHINGEHDDNRLENLRLLCPNCHALTPTYRGRNVRRRRERRNVA